MALRWRKEKQRTGLAAHCHVADGFDLMQTGSDEPIIRVRKIRSALYEKNIGKWYWYGGVADTSMNTCEHPVKTAEDAKTQARSWVDSLLKQSVRGKSNA